VVLGLSVGLVSALALLVLGVTATDDPHHATSTDDAAVLTDRLYAASNLHFLFLGPVAAELDNVVAKPKGFKRFWTASGIRPV